MSRSRSVHVFTHDDPPFPEARGAAERIEAGVFRATFGESARALRSYYDDHLPQTVFVLVDDDGWAGMLRLGVPGPLPSPSLEDAVAPPFSAPPELADVPMVDVLTAAVRTRFRSRGLFEELLAAAADVAAEHRCARLGAMTDHRVLAYLRHRGLPVALHTGVHPYYGSPATAFVSVTSTDLADWLPRARAA